MFVFQNSLLSVYVHLKQNLKCLLTAQWKIMNQNQFLDSNYSQL